MEVFSGGDRESLRAPGSHICSALEGKSSSQESNTAVLFSLSASVTLIHHYRACVAAHHCNQVETELVGDVTYTTHRECCVGDLCNSAVASTVAPPCVLAAAAAALAWLLPALWRD